MRILLDTHAFLCAGERMYLDAAIAWRLAIWLGAMLALFATVAAWPASTVERRRLVGLALAGLAISGAASAIALAIRVDFDPAHG
jgi:hypothetical protein